MRDLEACAWYNSLWQAGGAIGINYFLDRWANGFSVAGQTTRIRRCKTVNYTPLQSFFEHTFYAIADLLFLILNAYAASIVNRGKWRLHLSWLIPFVIQTILTFIYRVILTIHYFLGIHLPQSAYFFGLNCLYVSDVFGIYGNFILCRTLKRMVNNADVNISPVQTSSQPSETVWPPPPTKGVS